MLLSEADRKLKEDLLEIAKIDEPRDNWRERGKPHRWWEDPTWRCVGDHVSKRYVKSEAKGGGVCSVCFCFVHLTFPEDEDGFLPSPEEFVPSGNPCECKYCVPTKE